MLRHHGLYLCSLFLTATTQKQEEELGKAFVPLPIMLLLLLHLLLHRYLLLLLPPWIPHLTSASLEAKLVLQGSSIRSTGIGFKAIHVGSPRSRLQTDTYARQGSFFPYARHRFQQRQQQQQQRKSMDFVRESIAGLGQGFGEYYTTVKLGSSGQAATLIIDTGSELSWSQCLPCKSCAASIDPAYDAARSISYKTVACSDGRLCSNSSQGTYAYCAREGEQCRFAAFYGDGSFSYGTMSTDSLIIESAAGGGGATTIRDFAFGCAMIDFQLVPTGASGILGLNAGKMALPMQLGQRFGWKFSHCFPDKSSHLNSSGVIFFGDAELPHNHVTYTSVVVREINLQRKFYHVSLKAVKIEREEMVFLPQGSLVILDSGSSFTSLSRPVYSRLREAFLRHRPPALEHLQNSSFGDLDTCFSVGNGQTDELLRSLPSLSLVFDDGAEIELPKVSILLPVSQFRDHVQMCFAFEDGGLDEVSIIGNYQQQDLWIEYDIKRSRVGFAHATCAVD